jgi:hypothetical protein
MKLLINGPWFRTGFKANSHSIVHPNVCITKIYLLADLLVLNEYIR